MDINKMLRLPALASEHGAEVDKLIIYVHYLMIALFIGWAAYFVVALYKFRKARNPKADYAGVTVPDRCECRLLVAPRGDISRCGSGAAGLGASPGLRDPARNRATTHGGLGQVETVLSCLERHSDAACRAGVVQLGTARLPH